MTIRKFWEGKEEELSNFVETSMRKRAGVKLDPRHIFGGRTKWGKHKQTHTKGCVQSCSLGGNKCKADEGGN